MVETPMTRYVAVGDADVAYQVVGDAAIDLLYFYGLGSHFEHFWDMPEYAGFLERLAKFYNVPVDQLLPREDVTAPVEGDTAGAKLAVDLLKLSQLRGQPFEMLVRFLKMIQVQRQDFNGKVITVRGDDTRAISAMLDVPVDQVGQRLDALDLLYRPM
jgi:hypothetical protein